MKIFPTKNKNPCKRLLQCVYDFRNWTHNFQRALRQVKKQHLEVKLWNWGPATICHTMTCVQFFFVSPHPFMLYQQTCNFFYFPCHSFHPRSAGGGERGEGVPGRGADGQHIGIL